MNSISYSKQIPITESYDVIVLGGGAAVSLPLPTKIFWQQGYPIARYDVVIPNICGTGVDIVATKAVK